ncbi:tetratricopeptide repeat protein [Phenylobacterium sp.]|uniref:O-linked N-acetylglucosamine transferase, SPINDLY family protein n=1 Tax=Phenylobacterium sp. TaxID=1871053 RepID=UPI0027241546|nr:tetratricopeptide repeat protein [Phenylobacterium sp.]MDO8378361.1 tetratricopeptide repeat protein [Phenylobacterium sp.]
MLETAMPQDIFLSALQKTTSGTQGLGELINTANALSGAGRSDQATELYKIWVAYNPEHPQAYVAHFNRGCLHTQGGELAPAIEALQAAIAVSPDFMPAYINLGGVLERNGQIDQAVALWRTGLDHVAGVTGERVGYKLATLKQLARVLADNHRIEAAELAMREALALDPTQRDVIEQYLAMRLAQCKWPVIESLPGVDRQALLTSIHPLSMAAYTDDPLLQLASASRYVELGVETPPDTEIEGRRHAPIDLQGRRLKVGYISSDLRDHAVGYLMAELFELHDKAKVEVFAYYCGTPSADPLNLRTRQAVEHWVDIRPMSDAEAARRIEEDGIDILVDVNGHTRESRTAVFARRPAPILVNWLGYPGTMGSPYHHYIIADGWIIPPGSEIYYSEKVVRLPCYQPNDRKRVVSPERPTRQSADLPEDAFVFCCFNGAQKISRATFERWLAILGRVEGSVLWLLESTPETHERLLAFAELQGIARERLIFAPKLHNSLHLARYPLADLFLDTAAYGAHTTASDALWMGVPMVTLSGRSFAARVCGSLVRASGLADLVCSSPDEYVERAVALGHDRAQIAAYKAQLDANRTTCDLFNMEKLVGSLEDLYANMVVDYQQGALPRPDLANLDLYMKVGVDHDHEAREMLAVEDYHHHYKAKLARRHLARPIPADARLWTPQDIALAEGETAEVSPPQPRPRRVAAD